MAALRAAPLFGDLTDEQLRLIAFGARKRAFAQDEVLFREGRAADGGVVLVRGYLELTAEDGSRIAVEPGGLVSELALISRKPHAHTATATTEGVVMTVERSLFRRMVEEYPDIADKVRERIGLKLHALLASVEDIPERLERAAGGVA